LLSPAQPVAVSNRKPPLPLLLLLLLLSQTTSQRQPALTNASCKQPKAV
jgi:hypothetical protein